MRQFKALIIDSQDKNNFDNSFIVSLSKTDYDTLKLLRQYLPNLDKTEFNDQEKEVIEKYNKFIDNLRDKAKSAAIQVDFGLKKIYY